MILTPAEQKLVQRLRSLEPGTHRVDVHKERGIVSLSVNGQRIERLERRRRPRVEHNAT